METDLAPPSPLVLPEDAPRFVGSAACAECHPDEFEQHRASPHSRTVFLPDSAEAREIFQTEQRLTDGALGVTYTYGFPGDKAQAALTKTGGTPLEMTPAYIIGSGKYGRTPLFERDGVFMEGRTSHYPSMGKWWWTPGQITEVAQRQPEGRILGADEAVACLLCHGTVLVQERDRLVGPGSRLDVGCERCHGPGREHVAAARKGQGGRALHSFRTASSATITTLCAQCHRSPNKMSTHDLARDRNLPRFAGTALAESRCYKQSAGKLSCVTCHNPHTAVETRAEPYEQTCLSCHSGSGPREPACPVNPRGGCIPCHMPRQSIDFPGGASFHNHWIRARPTASPSPP